MIAVRLIGGLGNQMFQYACGRALAERLRTTVQFDLSAFSRYQLHRYGLAGFCTDVSILPWHLTTGSRFWSLVRRFQISPAHYFKLRGIHWIHEDGNIKYKPERFKFDGSAYLDGYWQSSRYFDDFEHTIRDHFRLVTPLQKVLQQRLDSFAIGKTITVSAHVRRGDYVTDLASNAVHGTMGADYYQRALEHMAGQLLGPFRLIVFSDDIAWARENLQLPAATVYVDANERHPQVDMQLMAACDHHIIANSSFSWWGAWLNPSPAKVVVAPARWFRNTALLQDDICPQEWVRL